MSIKNELAKMLEIATQFRRLVVVNLAFSIAIIVSSAAVFFATSGKVYYFVSEGEEIVWGNRNVLPEHVVVNAFAEVANKLFNTDFSRLAMTVDSLEQKFVDKDAFKRFVDRHYAFFRNIKEERLILSSSPIEPPIITKKHAGKNGYYYTAGAKYRVIYQSFGRIKKEEIVSIQAVVFSTFGTGSRTATIKLSDMVFGLEK